MAWPAIVAGGLVFYALSSLIAKLGNEEELTQEEIDETERMYTQMGYGEAWVEERKAELEQEYAPQAMRAATTMGRTAAGMRDAELGLATGSPIDRLMAITGKSREELASRLDPGLASGPAAGVSQVGLGHLPPMPPVAGPASPPPAGAPRPQITGAP